MVVRSLYLWILVYSTLCFSTLENNFVSTTLRDPWAKVSTECSSSTLKDYSNSSKLPTRHTGIQEFHVSLLFLGARLPHNCLVPSDATCQRTRKQLDTRSVSLPVCKQHLRTVETALDSFESIVRPSSNSTLLNNKYSCYFVHVLPTCVYFALLTNHILFLVLFWFFFHFALEDCRYSYYWHVFSDKFKFYSRRIQQQSFLFLSKRFYSLRSKCHRSFGHNQLARLSYLYTFETVFISSSVCENKRRHLLLFQARYSESLFTVFVLQRCVSFFYFILDVVLFYYFSVLKTMLSQKRCPPFFTA